MKRYLSLSSRTPAEGRGIGPTSIATVEDPGAGVKLYALFELMLLPHHIETRLAPPSEDL